MRHWESDTELGRPTSSAGTPDDVLVGVALRLRRQVEHQSRLVERSSAVLPSGELAELRRGLARLRRAGRHLLVLGHAEPGTGEPLTVSEILRSAAGPGERVSLGPAPLATVAAPAADDVAVLVAELVDHVLDLAPHGVRVGVQGRWTDEGGVTVEVTGETSGDPFADRDEAEVLALAAQLGRRSGLGVTVPSGSTYVVHCPSVHVSVSGQGAAPGWRAPDPEPATPPSGWQATGADDLFGPLSSDAPLDDLEATPIFAAVASAWFREEATADSGGWESPGDAVWAAAAARSAETEDAEADLTTAGLPRRRPGNQMVTPSVRSGVAPSEIATPAEREPERVRSRLAVYQQGLRRGRHRAVDPPSNGHAVHDDHDPWLRGLDA